MTKQFDVRYEVRLINGRINRREAKGLSVSADLMWGWINTAWPEYTQEMREAIFQNSGNTFIRHGARNQSIKTKLKVSPREDDAKIGVDLALMVGRTIVATGWDPPNEGIFWIRLDNGLTARFSTMGSDDAVATFDLQP